MPTWLPGSNQEASLLGNKPLKDQPDESGLKEEDERSDKFLIVHTRSQLFASSANIDDVTKKCFQHLFGSLVKPKGIY